MLPFLKNKQEAGMATVDEVKTRKPDEEEGGEYGFVDAVVEDIFEAIEKKDRKLLKLAIEALIDHIKEEDELQDASEEF